MRFAPNAGRGAKVRRSPPVRRRRTDMTLYQDYKTILRGAIAALSALALLAVCSCNSAPGTKTAEAQSAGSASGGSGGHIDVMCIGDRINSPAESFHYSYTYSDASASENDEADITPQTMVITAKDKSGAHSYHGVRSDEQSWGSAVLDLAHLRMTVMSARLDSLNGTSSIASQGADPVNNYQATKYSIDTTRANASDRNSFETLFGKGSTEKGTIWMGQDGCMVKLVLDEALAQSDGSLSKTHYEISRTKK
jgi:hypothetical protein